LDRQPGEIGVNYSLLLDSACLVGLASCTGGCALGLRGTGGGLAASLRGQGFASNCDPSKIVTCDSAEAFKLKLFRFFDGAFFALLVDAVGPGGVFSSFL
jgi:hypothetical protein